MDISFPYSSIRVPSFGAAGVATTQPLAAQAGREMLARGGNAVDAAVATAITLTVVEPTMNGIGGDSFAIIARDGEIFGLNASGRAAGAVDTARLHTLPVMPGTGWDPVTVPGAVSGWAALSQRFGKLPFEDLFQPAIRHARDGFIVPYIISRHWANQTENLRNVPGFAAAFLPHGRSPEAGERFHHPEQAETLRSIAETRGESFYRGALAARIAAFARETGGPLTEADLAAHQPEWVTPLAQAYRDRIVREIPPNGQGIAALIALGILGHFELGMPSLDDPDAMHLAVEATRFGLMDMHAEVAELSAMRMTPAEMLDPARLKSLAARIDLKRTSGLPPKPTRAEGTVYLCAADADGMMVSLIQSNYRGFGSGIVVPGTGIALHNRGACFSTDPAHPNAVMPGKRPMNTIIPGFLTEADGTPLAAFGVMGGAIQAQAHVQVVTRLVDHGLTPQAALDAPRWRLTDDGALLVESTFPEAWASALAERGHRIQRMAPWTNDAGAGQMFMRYRDGYMAATDGRRDGCVALL